MATKKKNEMEKVLNKYNLARKGEVHLGKHYGPLSGAKINLEELDLKTADELAKRNFPYIKEKKEPAS